MITGPNSATAIAHPNIALIKYWGDINPTLHLPANGSISMNLAECITTTTVRFDASLNTDEFTLDGNQQSGQSLDRVKHFMDRVRTLAGISSFARIESINNFPAGAGMASSASAFAALSLAATRASGLNLSEKDLSRLARLGSGSACRSVPAGFVEWQPGTNDEDSYSTSIAPPTYWDIADCIALVNEEEKSVSSIKGHALAETSLLQPTRIAGAPRRLEICRQALLKRDFAALAEIVELDSNLMHAVMLTSHPPLLYWQPATLAVIKAVQLWRKEGASVCYTIDAGPNVHVLCPAEWVVRISNELKQVQGVHRVITSHPGGPAEFV
jgi:diphosphomevalonate decarboxylase